MPFYIKRTENMRYDVIASDGLSSLISFFQYVVLPCPTVMNYSVPNMMVFGSTIILCFHSACVPPFHKHCRLSVAVSTGHATSYCHPTRPVSLTIAARGWMTPTRHSLSRGHTSYRPLTTLSLR